MPLIDWYTPVKAITERLVTINSVSPGSGEIVLADAIISILQEDNLANSYQLCETVPITHDRYQRTNAIAYLPGVRPEVLILLGHFDTVGITDYGSLESLATQPSLLSEHWAELMDGTPLDDPENWWFGRGAVDMKSGVAINIAIMRYFAQRQRDHGEPPPLSLLLLATPDEETESVGAMAGITWLAEQRRQRQLRYVGLINTDYISPRFPGDTERPIYSGTVGKLLPLFYVVGKAAHVGEPYAGIDANLLCAELVRDLCMNPALTDHVGDERTAPPVTLHQSDLKTTYNVQTPFAAWFYLNILTMTTTPAEALARLCTISQAALDRVLQRLVNQFSQQAMGQNVPQHLLNANVFTFADLYAATCERVGIEVAAKLIIEPQITEGDSRTATLRVIERLWQHSGQHGPAAVIAFAPPYYPHIPEHDTPFLQAIRAVAERHQPEGIVLRQFFPCLSDLSYMQIDPELDVTVMTANMPLWTDGIPQLEQWGYSVPFTAIEAAAIEGIANIGVYGQGAHQRDERVYMPYSFRVAPQLVYEAILEVAARMK